MGGRSPCKNGGPLKIGVVLFIRQGAPGAPFNKYLLNGNIKQVFAVDTGNETRSKKPERILP